MPYDYSRFQRIAKRLINKYGFTAKLRQTTSTGKEYNPTQTVTDTDVITVDQGNVVVGERTQENVSVRERQFIITGGEGIKPVKGDKLVVGELIHEIIRVDTVSPGNEDVLYTLAVKT